MFSQLLKKPARSLPRRSGRTRGQRRRDPAPHHSGPPASESPGHETEPERLLSPMFPVIRITIKTHDGQNKNPIKFNAIKNCKRESIEQKPPHITSHASPCRGVVQNMLNGRIYLNHEIGAQATLTGVVVSGCCQKFFLGPWMERESHQARASRILANTCSPGTGLTRPDRNSANRRFEISSHLSSIRVVEELRERSNESITMALSSMGKH